MEEKDVNSIASAVSNALAKLNTDTAAVKEKEKTYPEHAEGMDLPEVFKCPDCGAQVKGGIDFCQSCGCPLEWED
jgi:hypothetical protein